MIGKSVMTPCGSGVVVTTCMPESRAMRWGVYVPDPGGGFDSGFWLYRRPLVLYFFPEELEMEIENEIES